MTIAYAICAETDIPNKRGRAFSLLRVAEDKSEQPWHIFIVRWGRQVFGYVNRCPHNGVNLDWETNQFLDESGRLIVCGKHGSKFELATGKCVEGPCLGQGLEPIHVAVVDGDICVTGVALAEEAEAPDASASDR
ncbi:MAG: Rieske (2Fe-2S) protein [Rhodomicrobium sp.]|jgi:nitrite reductase/ring-hydroxylating ferredoxin subunit